MTGSGLCLGQRWESAGHGGGGHVGKRRCGARRADGGACRAWAMRSGDGRARCVAHREEPARALFVPPVRAPFVRPAPLENKLYDDFFSAQERVALGAMPPEQALESEVRLTRILLRRLFAESHPARAMDGAEMERRALALFKGAEMVAHLLQVQYKLLGDEGDGVPPVIAAALDALSEEWGIDL